ncbi:hypothetical protein AB0C19_17620 [Micromonospora sp. NPDC048842]|uniref:hypothetical protein n=1 Tax=Micromonospora sp. NPDC048842 TaxID=3154346 RepID=UPI0033D6B058
MLRTTPTTRRRPAGLIAGLILAGCHPGPSAPTPATPTPATPPASTSPALAATAPGLTPQQRLRLLADTITAAPADQTVGLPYTYLHTQSWTRATNVITRSDLQRWRRDTDDSGREVTRRLPDVRGLAHRPTSDERRQFAAAGTKSTRYVSGDLEPYLPEPLTTDIAELAGALAPRELAGEPAYPRMLVHGVIGVATSQYLNRAQRAATLRVLADVPTIAYQGERTDLTGRTGLGFTVTADNSQTQLIVHPRTGEILSAHEQVHGAKSGLFSYLLILERGHTATDTGTPSGRP